MVRLTAGDDLSEIAALQARAFSNPWSVESMQWELANTDVARLYVLRLSDALVGYCACWVLFDELHINSLAIDDAYRRQGMALMLLRGVIRDAQSAGATKATLEVRRSNTPALRLYERLGFSVDAVRKDYYEQPREDALVLWCRALAVA
jgi:ribosomal-protein-alanine N-acetyltransferase